MPMQVRLPDTADGVNTDQTVNYVLRNGELFNMVLLVPDDIPEESLASTVEGNVQEMCALFEGWDPR